jgi:hypothetical protein
MKNSLIITITLLLSACGMDVEEYNARVKYCNDKGMDIVTEKGMYPGAVSGVLCKDKQGNIFKNKEGK